MTLSKSDFQHIKWRLLGFLLVFCIGGLAVFFSLSMVEQAQHSQQSAQSLLDSERNRLAAAQEDRGNMAAYALEYGDLMQRDIFSDGQRLDWIEGMEKIKRLNTVLDFQYTIAPQQPYSPTPSINSGNFDLLLSGVTLRFDLLHEVQLLNFFDALRSSSKGWFIVDHCTLERTGLASDNPDAVARLKAECTGGWLTLKNRIAK